MWLTLDAQYLASLAAVDKASSLIDFLVNQTRRYPTAINQLKIGCGG